MMDEFVANEGKEEIEEEFDLNEILMELEEGEDKKEMYEEEAEEEMEAGEAEMEAGEEAEDMGEEEIDLEDMTEDDLKSFIEDVIADMVAAGELEAGEEMEAEMGDMEAEEEMGDMDMEALDEMDEVSWERQNNPGNGDTLKGLAPTKAGQTTLNEAMIDPETIDVIIQTLKTDPSLVSGETMAKILGAGVVSIFGAGFGITGLIDALKKGKLGKGGEELAQGIEDTASASGINKKKVAKTGFSEAEDEMSKMEELKKELQEVNLLNAKLLYTNKIFNMS